MSSVLSTSHTTFFFLLILDVMAQVLMSRLWCHVGLLRFSVLLPDQPIDPLRKRAVRLNRVVEHEQRLDELDQALQKVLLSAAFIFFPLNSHLLSLSLSFSPSHRCHLW